MFEKPKNEHKTLPENGKSVVSETKDKKFISLFVPQRECSYYPQPSHWHIHLAKNYFQIETK